MHLRRQLRTYGHQRNRCLLVESSGVFSPCHTDDSRVFSFSDIDSSLDSTSSTVNDIDESGLKFRSAKTKAL